MEQEEFIKLYKNLINYLKLKSILITTTSDKILERELKDLFKLCEAKSK